MSGKKLDRKQGRAPLTRLLAAFVIRSTFPSVSPTIFSIGDDGDNLYVRNDGKNKRKNHSHRS